MGGSWEALRADPTALNLASSGRERHCGGTRKGGTQLGSTGNISDGAEPVLGEAECDQGRSQKFLWAGAGGKKKLLVGANRLNF
jgi:hypothetical protein